MDTKGYDDLFKDKSSRYFKSKEVNRKKEEALKQALDIRKFEIELYWKRATYFWTIIGVIMVGFVSISVSKDIDSGIKNQLLILLACIGMVLSWGWFLVNKGSKFWQENWEKHVDMLEDEIMGPLYKTIFINNKSGYKEFLVGSGNFSVSKINQLISLYVTIIWVLLLLYILVSTFHFELPIDWPSMIIIAISFVTCVCFMWLAKSDNGAPKKNNKTGESYEFYQRKIVGCIKQR